MYFGYICPLSLPRHPRSTPNFPQQFHILFLVFIIIVIIFFLIHQIKFVFMNVWTSTGSWFI